VKGLCCCVAGLKKHECQCWAAVGESCALGEGALKEVEKGKEGGG
jgi:hypothetical protein